MTAARRKLLVSDTSPTDAETIRAAATNIGLDVKLTATGRQFKEAFVPFAPTVVALDLQLPDILWYDLLYWISETTRPPKLLLTAPDDEHLTMALKLATAWQLSVIAALRKPVPGAALEEALASVHA